MHPAVAVAIAAVVGAAIYFLTRRTPEPKRFGLKEARAAAQYVSTAGSARPVMAVVIGVLGYQDAVAEDVRALAEEMAAKNETLQAEVVSNNGEISGLEAEIRDLKGENEQLQLDMLGNDQRVGEATSIASLFTA